MITSLVSYTYERARNYMTLRSKNVRLIFIEKLKKVCGDIAEKF